VSFMSGVEKKIKTFNDIALIFLMTVIAWLIFIQVLFRYVLHIPMHFVEEILILAAVWLYLLGSVNASREESHINARVLEIFIGKVKNIYLIRMFSAMLTVIVTGWLTYWSYDFFMYSLKRWKISQVLGYPMIIMESAMLICFIFIFIYSIKEIFSYFGKYKNETLNGQ
jgi:TRAP-type C4-dicarboxylate transport system permease small subunit